MAFIRKIKWYVLVEDQPVGPFTLEELKKRGDITPFTKVRKKGDDNWLLAARVFALRSLFQQKKKTDFYVKPLLKDVLVLHSNRFSIFLWLLLLFFITIYLLVGYYARF